MYKLTWRIENFSLLPHKTGEFLTANFKVKHLDDINVFIQLYPKGQTCSHIIGYTISIEKPQAFEPDTKVKVSFYRNSKSFIKEYNLDRMPTHDSFLRREIEVDQFQDLLLSTDNVDFECVFLKPGNVTSELPVTYSEKTVVQTTKYVNNLPMSEIFFNAPSTSWKVQKLYKDFSDKFSLCFKFKDSLKENAVEIRKLSPNSTPLIICFQISLLHETTKDKIELSCGSSIWKTDTVSDPFMKYFDIDACVLKNFKTLHCYILTSEGNIATFDPNAESAPHNQIYFDDSIKNCPVSLMKQMHQSKIFSDVVFQVGSHQFAAHKCVLGSVSEVFAVMFKSNMVEEATNVINITDIDKDIIEKMLEFIYTGDVDIVDFENLVSLYFVAEKYQIMELKKLCSFRLIKVISVENCLEILKYADMFQDGCLKNVARNFMCENRKKIPLSSWKNFALKCDAELIADVTFNLSQNP